MRPPSFQGPQPYALVVTGAITGGTQRPFAYVWSLVSGPPAKITSYNKAEAQFLPQLPGTYVFQLQVSDGVSTATDLVTFEVRRSNPR